MLMRLVNKFMHEPCVMFYHITKILRYIKNRKYALPIVSQFYHCIQIATLSNNHFVFTFRNPLTTHLDNQRGRTVNVEGTWYDPAVFQPRVPPTLPVHASLTLDNGSSGARRHPAPSGLAQTSPCLPILSISPYFCSPGSISYAFLLTTLSPPVT